MTDAQAPLEPAQVDERKIARAVALGLPSLSIAAALVVGFVTGVPLAVLVLAAGALIGVIALLWASLRVLTGDAPLPPEIEALEASAGGVDALASRKTMLLRAIKDLENERALGKLDADDFRQVSETYRKDLKEVLRSIDATLEPFRAKAEALAKQHLDEANAALPTKTAPAGERASATKEEGAKREDAPGRVACSSCEASNEADARFCKGCGAALREEKETST